MKALAVLSAAILLALPGQETPAPQDTKAAAAAAATRPASIAVQLKEGKDATLTYRTISATQEMRMVPGVAEDPAGRILFEQAMSQQLMQSRLELDVAVEIAGIRLEPGRYGIGLSGFKDQNYDLAILDGRKRHNIPIVMDVSPFNAPCITFSFAALAADEVALLLHGGKRIGSVRIKVAGDKPSGETGARPVGD